MLPLLAERRYGTRRAEATGWHALESAPCRSARVFIQAMVAMAAAQTREATEGMLPTHTRVRLAAALIFMSIGSTCRQVQAFCRYMRGASRALLRER